jgi:hypothetical protein
MATFLGELVDQPLMARAAPLAARYTRVRNVRGDGSCFYRAALVAVGGAIVRSAAHPAGGGSGGGGGADAAYGALLRRVEAAPARLASLSPRHGGVAEDFLAPLLDWARGLGAAGATDESAVVAPLVGEDAPYLVYGARLLCALELLENPGRYAPGGVVLGSGLPLEVFVQTEVEPAHAYADAVQMGALARALGARLRVERLGAQLGDAVVLPLGGEGDGWALEGVLLNFANHFQVLYASEE